MVKGKVAAVAGNKGSGAVVVLSRGAAGQFSSLHLVAGKAANCRDPEDPPRPIACRGPGGSLSPCEQPLASIRGDDSIDNRSSPRRLKVATLVATQRKYEHLAAPARLWMTAPP